MQPLRGPLACAGGSVRAAAAYKRKIVAQTDQASEGQIGAILPKEGLYSSLLSTWRRQRDEGTLGGVEAEEARTEAEAEPRAEGLGVAEVLGVGRREQQPLAVDAAEGQFADTRAELDRWLAEHP
jgi:transposase-like protein